jgi:transposase
MVSDIENEDADNVYTYCKSRNSIEVMFDGFKNILQAAKTYMQNEDALEGNMLVNHIALQWYYFIYNMLKSNDQLKKYAVNAFVTQLKEIKKVKINGQWHTAPIIKSSLAMLSKMKISIT